MGSINRKKLSHHRNKRFEVEKNIGKKEKDNWKRRTVLFLVVVCSMISGSCYSLQHCRDSGARMVPFLSLRGVIVMWQSQNQDCFAYSCNDIYTRREITALSAVARDCSSRSKHLQCANVRDDG